MHEVDIILSTHNGSEYIIDLLESIKEQSFKDWRLIVRDDGSSDETPEIIDLWASSISNDVILLRGSTPSIGAAASFGKLMEISDAKYFMCCDQDDVWLPRKIETMLAKMRAAESELSPGTPILVHCDLRVTDKDLNVISTSFWKMSKVKSPDIRQGPSWRTERNYLLLQNMVTGCATMGNLALLKLATPVPKNAIMHDWWLAMVSGYLGEIRGIREPLVLYRQHGTNVVGAKNWGFWPVVLRAISSPTESIKRTNYILKASRSQAGTFQEKFEKTIESRDSEILKSYSRIKNLPFVERRIFIFKNRIKSHSLARSIAVFFFS